MSEDYPGLHSFELTPEDFKNLNEKDKLVKRIAELEAQLESQSEDMILQNDENYALRYRIAKLEGTIREVLYFIDQEMPHVVLLNELLPPDIWERIADKLRKVVNHD